jgi:hypothetical protein
MLSLSVWLAIKQALVKAIGERFSELKIPEMGEEILRSILKITERPNPCDVTAAVVLSTNGWRSEELCDIAAIPSLKSRNLALSTLDDFTRP